jgi:hypothetical protein
MSMFRGKGRLVHVAYYQHLKGWHDAVFALIQCGF